VKKINKITAALFSAMLSGNLYAADTNVVSFIPGETIVQNGDMVAYNGTCFIAKNNPGVWEAPSADSWFWDATECSDEPNPNPNPEPDPEPEPWFWALTECSGEPSPEPDVTEVSILSPVASQLLKVNEAIVIKARIDGESAAKVEFWVNNTKLAEKAIDQSNLLYSQAWTPSEAGSAAIDIFVFDKNNQKIEQKSVSVKVEAEGNDDFTAPVVTFTSPTNGSTVNKTDTVSISINASDADKDLTTLVVNANNQQICTFDAAVANTFNCDWQPTQTGSVTLSAIATDAQDLSSTTSLNITIEEETIEPPVTPPGGLCEEFNVYPDWTRGDHATTGDIMVNNNIAYSAMYWTQSKPGSDSTWALHLNCDGSEPGTAPLLSLPNPMDPVRLEVAGWPNTFVVASPSLTAPATLTIETSNSADLADVDKLTATFVSMIEMATQASSSSIIINSDVLDKATQDKGLSSEKIAVKEALIKAVDSTGSKIDIDAINALSNDLKGWAQAHNLIISTLAPEATFGWSLSIGDFAYNTHSGRQSVWNAASNYTADLLNKLALYKADSATKADFITFTKSETTAALSNDQWHNALEYVKQVTDYAKVPAMLADMPTDQAANYFMGDSTHNAQIRKAAFSNIFAILFNKDTATLTGKIEQYQAAKVPVSKLWSVRSEIRRLRCKP
jgi:hypothetical protein